MLKFLVCLVFLLALNGLHARPRQCDKDKIEIVADCGVWRYLGSKKSFECKKKLPKWFAECGQRKCELWALKEKKICWAAKNTNVPYGTSRHIASCKKLGGAIKKYCGEWVKKGKLKGRALIKLSGK